MTQQNQTAPARAIIQHPAVKWLLQALGAAAFILLVPLVFKMQWANFKPLFTATSLRFLSLGMLATIVVSIEAIILSLPLATLLALGRISPIKWISWPCIAFIEVLRSLPLLLLIFYINLRFPGLTIFADVSVGSKGSFIELLITSILSQGGMATMVALTFYTAAVNAELLRSGILSLERGQAEAARSLGLSYRQTMQHVILPQAYRRILAPLIAQFTILVKDTSLGAIIGFLELLKRGQILYQRDFNPMETLYVIALIYFVINYCLGLTQKLVARRQPTVPKTLTDNLADI